MPSESLLRSIGERGGAPAGSRNPPHFLGCWFSRIKPVDQSGPRQIRADIRYVFVWAAFGQRQLRPVWGGSSPSSRSAAITRSRSRFL